MPSPTMTENPFQAIHDAIWRKLKDFSSGGGAELLAEWADLQNPEKAALGGSTGSGLTLFELNDSEDGGFPSSISSAESPALYVGGRPSQKYDFSPGRYIDFPEKFEVVGCVSARSIEPSSRFLWLVLRALWWDYPRLLDDANTPLPGIKSVTIFEVNRKPLKTTDLFWKFEIGIEVLFCVSLQDWTVQ